MKPDLFLNVQNWIKQQTNVQSIKPGLVFAGGIRKKSYSTWAELWPNIADTALNRLKALMRFMKKSQKNSNKFFYRPGGRGKSKWLVVLATSLISFWGGKWSWFRSL